MSRRNSKKQEKANNLAEQQHWRNRLKEICFILSVGLALFLFISFVSYHSSDPSWSHITASKLVKNAAGKAGAWVSDVMLLLFGYLSYLFPLVMLYGAWNFFRHRRDLLGKKCHATMWLRCVGFTLLLLGSAAFFAMHIPVRLPAIPFNGGGIVGTLIATQLLRCFNVIGSTLILLLSILTGITLLSRISWFHCFEKMGRLSVGCVIFLYDFIVNIRWRGLFKRFTKLPNRWRHDKLPEPVDIQNPVIESKPVIKKIPVSEETQQTPIEHHLPKISIRHQAPESNEQEFKMPQFKGSEIIPKLSLLDKPSRETPLGCSEQELQQTSKEVELRLADFGVGAKVVAVHPGPVVTRFELQLAAGTKVSKISNLVKDLARSLSVLSVRVVEVIPGKSVIGLELPNKNRETVMLHEVLATRQYQNARSKLTLALGKDIAGHPVIVDLAKMPHLLVAGTTGSGKSVSLNSMLLSLLYKATPRQLRLLMIDPKMLELAIYEGIPHLLTPVVTDMKDAAVALRWCVGEMERRYRLMASLGVRNIAGYNVKIAEAEKKGEPLMDPFVENGEPHVLETLPQIVVIADEFADMMVVVGKKVETLIVRLAQKARAAGIHLIFATQRPSVDVITGLIKANIPTRIAFQVSSKVDSRTILDQQGAEQLLGNGDMLYLAPGTGVPMRVHGPYVDDDEVHRVVEYLKSNCEPDYVEDLLDETLTYDVSKSSTNAISGGIENAEQDPLYDEAVDAVIKSRRVSVSSVQRRFKIGYNRAARIVEAMETAGVVSAMESNGSREVLVPPREN